MIDFELQAGQHLIASFRNEADAVNVISYYDVNTQKYYVQVWSEAPEISTDVFLNECETMEKATDSFRELVAMELDEAFYNLEI